jgi:hypothetical protein
MRYHVDRVRASDSTWRTTVSLMEDSPLEASLRASWKPAQFEIDEFGAVTVRLTNGTTLPLPRSGQFGNILQRNGVSTSIHAHASSQVPSGSSARQGWADQLVRSAVDCLHETQSVKQSAALDHHDASGKDHYVRRGKNGGSAEYVVDGGRGLVTESTLTSGGMTTHTVTDYADGPNGTELRRGVRIERFIPVIQSGLSTGTGGRSETTTLSLSKVVIDGQAVLP